MLPQLPQSAERDQMETVSSPQLDARQRDAKNPKKKRKPSLKNTKTDRHDDGMTR